MRIKAQEAGRVAGGANQNSIIRGLSEGHCGEARKTRGTEEVTRGLEKIFDICATIPAVGRHFPHNGTARHTRYQVHTYALRFIGHNAMSTFDQLLQVRCSEAHNLPLEASGRRTPHALHHHLVSGYKALRPGDCGWKAKIT